MADRVTVFNKSSGELKLGVDLPDNGVDIIVTELVDSGLLGERIIPALMDVRARGLLARGGRVIPEVHTACTCYIYGLTWRWPKACSCSISAITQLNSCTNRWLLLLLTSLCVSSHNHGVFLSWCSLSRWFAAVPGGRTALSAVAKGATVCAARVVPTCEYVPACSVRRNTNADRSAVCAFAWSGSWCLRRGHRV